MKKSGFFNKHKRTILIATSLVVLVMLAAGIKIWEDVMSSNIHVDDSQTATIYWFSTPSTEENFARLADSAVLKNTRSFKRLATLTGYADMIKPGRYVVSASTSNLELLRMMAGGKQTPVDVLFKYAQRKSDVALFWSSVLEADNQTLQDYLNNPAFCDSLGFDTSTIISLFIPNTYNFYWNTSAEQLLQRMHTEYKKFWNESRIAKLERLGLTPQQVSTLASIVQKETYQTDEMPIVAGAYINRLRKGMPLQADPTLIFAMGDNRIKRVAGAMLQVESPYNTYKYKGLPPGPICVPSIKSIDAVLNYQQHSYIYFCAREDFSGYHNFAVTFAQHQQNARRYQRELTKKGIK